MEEHSIYVGICITYKMVLCSRLFRNRKRSYNLTRDLLYDCQTNNSLAKTLHLCNVTEIYKQNTLDLFKELKIIHFSNLYIYL